MLDVLFLVADLLPTEMWLEILAYSVGKHGIMTYRVIMLTSRRFYCIAQCLQKPQPLPKIYLCPYNINALGIRVGDNITHMVSYRDILVVTGQYSAVSIILPEILSESQLNPDTTVFTLSHRGLGWFNVHNVTQNCSKSMDLCKHLGHSFLHSLCVTRTLKFRNENKTLVKLLCIKSMSL